MKKVTIPASMMHVEPDLVTDEDISDCLQELRAQGEDIPEGDLIESGITDDRDWEVWIEE